MLLYQYNLSRDNNFNLLRFVAASLVLYSHSFALATGSAASEPLRELLGMTWGDIALDVFFVTSGFLVTGSLLVRESLLAFAAARFLRIYPGLWVALGLTVVVTGSCATTLSVLEFFQNPETWKYLVKNGSVLQAAYALPGVFEDLPWKRTVNGSLWSLPIEVRMYGVLAFSWILARRLPGSAAMHFSRICITLALLGGAVHMVMLAGDAQQPYVSLGYMFFSGAALRLLQDRVHMSGRLAAMMMLAILVAASDKAIFGIVYSLFVPYLVIYLAFVPQGPIRRFNRFGDYSYGIYIYAFPVQQLLAFWLPGIQPYEMVMASFGATVPLSMVSWHLVESRALALKTYFERSKIPLTALRTSR